MSKIVEIRDPDTGQVGYYDFGTDNESFLLTAQELKTLGIKKWYMCLEVKYPNLGVQDLDPFSDKLTKEQIGALVIESKMNPWFFARVVARVPAKGAPKPFRFYLSRASHAMIWCYIHSIDMMVCQPRQTYKTTTAMILIQHAFIYDQHNINIPFLHIKDKDANRNAGMFRDYVDAGPKWACPWAKEKRPPGTKSIKYEAHGNAITVHASSESEDRARDVLRGDTLFIVFSDEYEYTPYIDNTIEGATPAMKSARDIARMSGGRCCIIYTSTPGNLDSAPGKAAQKMIDATPIFGEKYYDLTDEGIEKMFEPGGSGVAMIRRFYIEFNYLQLRKNEEWLAEHHANAVATDKMDEYKRGILLQRYRGGSQVLFRQEDIDYISDHVIKHDHEILLLDKFILYVFKHEVHNIDMMSDTPYFDIEIPYLVGIDIAAGTGGDFTSITIVHPYTLKIVGELKSQYLGPFDLMRVIIELARLLPKCLFCPESNGVGKTVMDFFQEGALLNRVYTDERADTSKNTLIVEPMERSLKEKAMKRKYIGTNVSPSVRGSMISLLKGIVKTFREKINTPFVVKDLKDLVINKGRVEAGPNCHDDCIMSYLHTVYVLTYGRKLERYGINVQRCQCNLARIINEEYQNKQAEETVNNLLPYEGHGPEQQMLDDIIKASKNTGVDEYGYERKQYAGTVADNNDPYRGTSISDLQFFYSVNDF